MFHRDLAVLGQAPPPTFVPANRLQVTAAARPPAAPVPAWEAPPPVAGRPTGTLVAVSEGTGGESTGGEQPQLRRRPSSRVTPSGGWRPGADRRRQVLLVLTMAVIATAIVSIVTGSGGAVACQVASDVALVGYMALLVRRRQARTKPRRHRGDVLAPHQTGPITGLTISPTVGSTVGPTIGAAPGGRRASEWVGDPHGYDEASLRQAVGS